MSNTSSENLQNEILDKINHPKELEALYRKNQTEFHKTFNALYPQIADERAAQVWFERLNYQQESIQWIDKKDLLFILVSSFIAAAILKLPQLMKWDLPIFFTRNMALTIMPVIAIFFMWKNSFSLRKSIVPIFIFILAALYINLLPKTLTSDTINLVCIHLPLLLWMVIGFSFVGNDVKNNQLRMQYLRFNGDLVVIGAVLMLAGILFSGITIGLFSMINRKIVDFYVDNIALWGGAGIPILGTYIAYTHPQIINKISPLIAKIFTPIVLVMATSFLVSMVIIGKNPYNDREALMMFNLLLIGVMAIILFSLSEATKSGTQKINMIILCALAIVTALINIIALSAISFRLVEFGWTPNRVAVLGGNILIFIHLLLVTFRLFKSIKQMDELSKIENAIAGYLPVYGVWTMFIVLILPVLFSYK